MRSLRQSGFTVIELAVLLVIVAVIFFIFSAKGKKPEPTSVSVPVQSGQVVENPSVQPAAPADSVKTFSAPSSTDRLSQQPAAPIADQNEISRLNTYEEAGRGLNSSDVEEKKKAFYKLLGGMQSGQLPEDMAKDYINLRDKYGNR